jgi:DNA gyrase subunit B
MASDDSYSTEHIEVLRGLEAVRRRPGMYVGDTSDGTGLHYMVLAVVELALGQLGRARNLTLTLHADNSITSEDDGSVLSPDVDPHQANDGRTIAELTFSAMSHRGNLHVPALPATTALCEMLRYEIRRDGQTHTQSFARGDPLAPPETRSTPSATPGTTVHLRPDPTMFESLELSFNRLADALRPLVHVDGDVAITLVDEREDQPRRLRLSGDLASWLLQLTADQHRLHPEPILVDGRRTIRLPYETGEIVVAAALQWIDSGDETVRCFVNGSAAGGGGTPIKGLRRGVRRALPGATTRGLVALVSVSHPARFPLAASVRVGRRHPLHRLVRRIHGASPHRSREESLQHSRSGAICRHNDRDLAAL